MGGSAYNNTCFVGGMDSVYRKTRHTAVAKDKVDV